MPVLFEALLIEELLIKASSEDNGAFIRNGAYIELYGRMGESLIDFTSKTLQQFGQPKGFEKDAVQDLFRKIYEGKLKNFSAFNSIKKSFKKHLETTCQKKINSSPNPDFFEFDDNLNDLFFQLKKSYDGSVMDQVKSVVTPFLTSYAEAVFGEASRTDIVVGSLIDSFFQFPTQIVANFSAEAYLKQCLRTDAIKDGKKSNLTDSMDDENTIEPTDGNKSKEELLRRKQNEIVRECIKEIKLDKHRHVIELAYFDGKEEKEISTILSKREGKPVPAGTVKSRKAVALEKTLKNLLLKIGFEPKNVDYYLLVWNLIDPVFYGKKVQDSQQRILTKMGINETAKSSMMRILAMMKIKTDEQNQIIALLCPPVDFDQRTKKEKAEYMTVTYFKIHAILFSHFGLNLSDWISS